MKILVTGSRWWADENAIIRMLEAFPHDTQLIHGAARGADEIADNVARWGLGWPKPRAFPAEWTAYGKRAGAIRNAAMLKEQPDLVIAFHNDLNRSKCGTRDCIDKASKLGIPVLHWSSAATERR